MDDRYATDSDFEDEVVCHFEDEPNEPSASMLPQILHVPHQVISRSLHPAHVIGETEFLQLASESPCGGSEAQGLVQPVDCHLEGVESRAPEEPELLENLLHAPEYLGIHDLTQENPPMAVGDVTLAVESCPAPGRCQALLWVEHATNEDGGRQRSAFPVVRPLSCLNSPALNILLACRRWPKAEQAGSSLPCFT